MSEFWNIFKKVDGIKVIKEYARAHVLLHALVLTSIEGTSKKSLEIVRESVSNKILKRLRKKYASYIDEYKNRDLNNIPHEHSNKVWVCWWQGMDNAPFIVKSCYQSLLKYLNDRDIVLITKQNYKDWVEFPDYIQEKFDNGIIGMTHMSDLLRLELLENYGGTWIDATVLCTGNNIPDYVWNSDLFIYQMMKPGLDAHAHRTSNWFITSCTNEPILCLVKELLYEYWRNNNRVIDYFIFHDFMELAIEAFPNDWMRVVPISNSIPHILLLRLAEQYDDKVWEAAKEMTPFHKMSWKFNKNQVVAMQKKGTFYDVIFRKND